MNQKLLAEALCGNNKAFVAIRSEADDFTNDAVARNSDRGKMALGMEAGSQCV